MSLRRGFTLGDWIVYPLEGRLVGEDSQQRVQPKTMDVLLLLAENAGEVVEREELLRRVWGERAPTDEPLTRCIGELRRCLGDTRENPDYILTIPKRGYRLLPSVTPLSPDDVDIDSADPLQLTESQWRKRRDVLRKIGVAAALLLVAALVEVAIERHLDDADIESPADAQPAILDTATADRSIVVLPFLDFSTDGNEEYFSDGVAEELLNMLARVPELRVVSRTSAFSYKGKGLDIPTIAAQLNVRHVLEGSVRKAGRQIRMSVQLIDAYHDTMLWSETYERELDDIFALQTEIADSVMSRLKLEFLDAETQVADVDAEAHVLFLQARHLGRRLSADALASSAGLLERALEIDPEYAAAWAELAAVYERQAGQHILPIDEGYALARAAANKALAIDPEHHPAHSSLGWITRNYDRDLAAAARHYEDALRFDPTSADTVAGAASMAASLGRIDLAIELMEYSVARDPVSAISHRNLGLFYFHADRLDDAISTLETALTLSPDQIGVRYFIGMAELLKGEYEAALTSIQREEFEGWRLIGLALVHFSLGDQPASDAALDELIRKYATGAAYNIAYTYAHRREPDLAFEWLGKAVEYNDPGIVDIPTEPLFANIRSDTRWRPFLENIGKSPEQLAAIEFEVSVPE